MTMPLKLEKAGLAVCFLILLVGATLQTFGGSSFLTTKSHNDWGNDDAYIGYHYAENLVHGQGLVFNPGERVEGYSDLLYVLAMTPALWLTDRDGVYFSILSSRWRRWRCSRVISGSSWERREPSTRPRATILRTCLTRAGRRARSPSSEFKG